MERESDKRGIRVTTASALVGLSLGLGALYWFGVNGGIYHKVAGPGTPAGFSGRPVDYVYFFIASPLIVSTAGAPVILLLDKMGL